MNFLRLNWLKFVVTALIFSVCLFIPDFGTNAQAAGHFVQLTWTPSPTPICVPVSTANPPCSSGVVAYNIYRSNVTGGPYAKIDQMAINLASTPTIYSYADSKAPAGVAVFYVVTTVDAQGVESIFSNEVGPLVPLGPPLPAAGLKGVVN